MFIVGIGTDIIEIDRIVGMPDNTQERLAVRVLTPDEYQHYVVLKAKAEHNAVRYLAKRWAGKEATSKALGTGIAAGVSFQHIEIKNLKSGQPTLTLSGKALALAQAQKANQWHISLADERRYATAFVTLSKAD